VVGFRGKRKNSGIAPARSRRLRTGPNVRSRILDQCEIIGADFACAAAGDPCDHAQLAAYYAVSGLLPAQVVPISVRAAKRACSSTGFSQRCPDAGEGEAK
jgi:hypothetical protein